MSKKHKNEETAEELKTPPEPLTGQPVTPAAEAEEPLKNQLLRLQADFDNFRKRTQRERNELFLFANESLFLEMLPVIDHFEMGFKSADAHQADNSVTEGFRIVYNQLLDVLKKFNVTAMDTVGEIFNPHRHEAVLHMPSDKPAETVIEQVRRGYLLGEKLLRAAQVIVSSGTPEENREIKE
ncbi:MAG: nucleotide exchange factor GrpE [Pontiellaceae bacterium]|jgi:molecular chaperone GrpE|nr:nucleotide exchange factor GrpE [Pontiellaceae bacterium]